MWLRRDVLAMPRTGRHKDCNNLSCAPLYLGDYLTKWESRKRRRLDRGHRRAYGRHMLWCEDNRAAVEKDHPSFKLTDVAKYLGTLNTTRRHQT